MNSKRQVDRKQSAAEVNTYAGLVDNQGNEDSPKSSEVNEVGIEMVPKTNKFGLHNKVMSYMDPV